jgi:hypothetical protein
MHHTIVTEEALRALAGRRGRDGISEIVLDLPGRSNQRQRIAERSINRGLHACGCHTGAALVVTASVVWALSSTSRQWMSLPTLWSFLTVAIVAAVVGKAVGIMWAEWRLRSTIKHLLSEPSTGTASFVSTEGSN